MTKNLIKQQFTLKETSCTIISDKQACIQIAAESIQRNRQALETYIAANPKFLYTLKPIPPPDQPIVARLMAEAAEAVDVGPMAAVAGAIADLAVADMKQAGCGVAVVEDGGEISATSNIPVDVAVAAGDDPLSKQFGFRLNEFPIGVATSSGRFSHALSFGDAEAATVFCKNASLADAVATAVGNVVKGENVGHGIRAGLERGMSIAGVQGVLIIFRGKVGMAGKIPDFIKVDA